MTDSYVHLLRVTCHLVPSRTNLVLTDAVCWACSELTELQCIALVIFSSILVKNKGVTDHTFPSGIAYAYRQKPIIIHFVELKMVNGFRYYRALESVSIASALFTALTIYPCQIRVHQR